MTSNKARYDAERLWMRLKRWVIDAAEDAARLVLKDFTTPDGTRIDPQSIEGGVGVSAHGELTGLLVDDHTQYQKEAEKGVAGGYAALGVDGLVPGDQLGAGAQDGTRFLRDDGTWQLVPAGVDALADLTDVALDTPADGDVLTYDGVAWVNQPPSGAGQYRQFVWTVGGGTFDFVHDADGNPLFSLEDVE